MTMEVDTEVISGQHLDPNEECLLRDSELVNQKLVDAKLERDAFFPTTQCIFFNETNLDMDGIRLLELDSDLLKNLQEGKSLTIKAEDEENCVLVTDESTYDLRMAETSNLLLVTQDFISKDKLDCESDSWKDLEFPRVKGMFSEYLEPRRIKPRLQKMRTLLEENLFAGVVEEKDEGRIGRKMTKLDLVNLVQASDSEIDEELKRLHAVEIEGHWRLLDPDYAHSVLNHILNLIEENSWPLDSVPVEEVLTTLKDLEPEEVVLGMLEAVGEEKDGSDDKLMFKISEEKVALNFAQVILQKAGRFNLEDFMQVWTSSLPESFQMKPDPGHLRGLALVDDKSMPPSVAYFPVENLPEDAGSRFDFLFTKREKWTKEDISPYLIDLTTPKLEIGAILLKFARASTLNGVKYFSSRKTRR